MYSIFILYMNKYIKIRVYPHPIEIIIHLYSLNILFFKNGIRILFLIKNCGGVLASRSIPIWRFFILRETEVFPLFPSFFPEKLALFDPAGEANLTGSRRNVRNLWVFWSQVSLRGRENSRCLGGIDHEFLEWQC